MEKMGNMGRMSTIMEAENWKQEYDCGRYDIVQQCDGDGLRNGPCCLDMSGGILKSWISTRS